MHRLLVFALALTAGPALAGERSYQITSFDRIRLEGPFDVRLKVGGPVSARAEGDSSMTDGLDVRVDGTVLVVRAASNAWGERPRMSGGGVPVIRLSTPTLRSASVTASGNLNVDGLRAMRADLSVNGAGSLTATGVEADQLNAILIGAGAITLMGKAKRATLTTNGSGTTEATALEAGDLSVRVEGPGRTRARATFTARVSNTGLGSVVVEGAPACTVTAPAGGAVTCGVGRP